MDWVFSEVLLYQHAPDGRRRAERRCLGANRYLEQRGRIEARLIDDKYRCFGIPRGEEAAPRVLGPARMKY